MAVNSAFARIFGHDNDALYLAPLGTQLPTSLTATPAAAFEDVGWISEDGFKENFETSIEKLRGHQGHGVVRTVTKESSMAFEFACLEHKALTLGLRYKELNVTTSGGVRSADRFPSSSITPMAAILDLFDADDVTVAERWCFPRFEVAPNGERENKPAELAMLPFTGEVIGVFKHFMTDLENP